MSELGSNPHGDPSPSSFSGCTREGCERLGLPRRPPGVTRRWQEAVAFRPWREAPGRPPLHAKCRVPAACQGPSQDCVFSGPMDAGSPCSEGWASALHPWF